MALKYFKLIPGIFTRPGYSQRKQKPPTTYEEMRDESAQKTCFGLDGCNRRLVLQGPDGVVYYIYAEATGGDLVIENKESGNQTVLGALPA